MHAELLNLLPPERLRAKKRGYFIRLATVSVYMLVGIVVASGALLVPSYLYINQQVEAETARAADLDRELASSNGKQVNQRLSGLAATATYLSRLSNASTATAALRGILSVPRAGIVITGFTYTPATSGKADGKLMITGTSATREALQAYSQALGALPYVSNVDLPIGTFAKDADIPFTISLTGTMHP